MKTDEQFRSRVYSKLGFSLVLLIKSSLGLFQVHLTYTSTASHDKFQELMSAAMGVNISAIEVSRKKTHETPVTASPTFAVTQALVCLLADTAKDAPDLPRVSTAETALKGELYC